MCRPSASCALCPAGTITEQHFSAKSETVNDDKSTGFGAGWAESKRRIKSVTVGSTALDNPAVLRGEVMSTYLQPTTRDAGTVPVACVPCVHHDRRRIDERANAHALPVCS